MPDPSPVKANHIPLEEELIVAESLRERDLIEEEEVDVTQVQPPQWPTPTEAVWY